MWRVSRRILRGSLVQYVFSMRSITSSYSTTIRFSNNPESDSCCSCPEYILIFAWNVPCGRQSLSVAPNFSVPVSLINLNIIEVMGVSQEMMLRVHPFCQFHPMVLRAVTMGASEQKLYPKQFVVI
jgi:hypothetical protein